MKRSFFRNPRLIGSLFYFSLWASVGSYGPFVNVYFAQLGLTGLHIGLISACMSLMSFLVGPPLSMLADRRRWQKQMLLWSLGGAAILMPLFIFPRTFLPIFLLALLRAVFISPMMPIADGLVARMATRYRIDYGQLRLWGSLSFAVAAILCGALWERLGWPAMFITGALLMAPVMVCALPLESNPVPTRHVAPSLRHVRRDRGLLALLVTTFLVGIAEGVYSAFSGVYMDALGGGKILVGALFGLSALCELPMMHYSGYIFRKLGKPATVLLGYGLVGAALLGYALARSPWVLLLFAMLKGMGFALHFVGSVSLVDERSPESWTATLQSLTNAARGLAPLLTVPLGGLLADRLGLPTVFTGAGITAMLAVGVLAVALIARQFKTAPLVDSESI
ncbi:MAG: MFS transporter [Anaerolineae bacterium]|nr:MFS transporter [Anaerolineae bacterium]